MTGIKIKHLQNMAPECYHYSSVFDVMPCNLVGMFQKNLLFLPSEEFWRWLVLLKHSTCLQTLQCDTIFNIHTYENLISHSILLSLLIYLTNTGL
jgi:hypothetical protein